MIPSPEELLFAAATSFEDPSERQAFLDMACTRDPALKDRLSEMLRLQPDAEAFFQLQPASEDNGEANSTAEREEVGGRIGRYRLIERIGEGGCGVVYAAEQETPVRRRVALKIIKLGLDTKAVVERFERERQALAQMDHPNIARALDAGATASGRPYFVMELVHGEPITAFCDRRGLKIPARIQLFEQICRAIHHAHQKGVIHRDIKPSNILIDEQNGAPLPKVIDFGIAKATEFPNPNFTRFDQLLGTPAYMSPEQIRNSADVDTRSDIYSLGALLCELLCGHTPFDEALAPPSSAGIRHRVQEEEPPRPSDIGKKVEPARRLKIAANRGTEPRDLITQLQGDLDCIVLKALEKDRSRRYDSAVGLGMDVQRYLQNEVVLARPPTRIYRLRKLIRRNKAVFLAAGIALLGLISGSIVSSWMFLRERAARQEQARLWNEAQQRELVALAAVRLIKYGDFRGGNQLLHQVPVNHVPSSLEAAHVFADVAQWHLQAGRIKEAAALYLIEARGICGLDLSDRAIVSFELLPAAAIIAYAGEKKLYEELQQLAIRRFAATANAQVAEQVLKTCLLLPPDEPTLNELRPFVSLVSNALDQKTGVIGRRPENAAWANLALALWHYRVNEFTRADEFIEKCLISPSMLEPRSVSALSLRASIEWKLGKPEEAAKVLDQARRIGKDNLTNFKWQAGMTTEQWTDWIDAAVLFREAERIGESRPMAQTKIDQ